MSQPDAWRMIRRRAAAAGIAAPIGCHTFRATGITAYLANGGALEHAQEMAAPESPRTTKLYDRTKERLTRTRWNGSTVNRKARREANSRFGWKADLGEQIRIGEVAPIPAIREPAIEPPGSTRCRHSAVHNQQFWEGPRKATGEQPTRSCSRITGVLDGEWSA